MPEADNVAQSLELFERLKNYGRVTFPLAFNGSCQARKAGADDDDFDS